MGLYTKVYSNVLFPLHERLKKHRTVAVLKNLERTQWLDSEKLDALRVQRLQALLIHAKEHVPYYRDVFASVGFDPEEVTSLRDLEKLPFLTKTEIREQTERFQADNAIGLSKCNTGGSCGDPLVFFIGKERVSHDVAAKWRAMRWWNVDIGDPEIVVWGSAIEITAQDYVRSARDKLFRSKLLSAFEMSDAKLDEFIEEIRRFRPLRMFGYPTSFWLIARHAQKRGIKMDDLGIRAVFVTSEMLYDNQRELISQVFGCPVANEYGGRDAGYMAHECPEGKLHITAEDIIIELVDGDGKVVPAGESGEVVVTNLASRDFPFIRYRNGDVAVMDDKPCACGRGLPVLREIQGRTTDFLVATDGTMIHSAALAYVMRSQPGIESFKIIQEDLEHTDVLLVPGPQFDESVAKARVVSSLKSRLGENVEITVQVVNDIPAEKSGKYRYVVSKVQQ